MALAAADWPRAAGDANVPLLALRGVLVSYGSLRVLNGVEFAVRPGELVALTGENGAGKSTVVRCIAGDMVPDAGLVEFAGARVRSSAAVAAAGLAVVWQDAALCDNLDIAANLFLGREKGRWPFSETKAFHAANEILSSYGVSFTSSRPMRSLSKGQRQLVAVARAMQCQPLLLVLDEPTASLGAQEARQVEELIAQLKARGTSVLLVSHDMEQVFALADRILVLHGGRVAADLAPAATHPDEVVAIMTGHDPGTTARHQLGRLQSLVDQLAQAKPGSSLPLILSALASSLATGQLCIHLLEERALRLVAATGLPSGLLRAWSVLPVGPAGGPMGCVAESGRTVVDEDIGASTSWARYAALGRAAGVRSSWSVPLIGQSGLIGVLTGCRPFAGQPHRDQVNLVSLYAGYAAGAIERDKLFEEVTARNRVLETIREVLETLAGPEPVPSGLLRALQSLQRGLRASGVELWSEDPDERARCVALVDAAGRAEAGPPERDPAFAEKAFSAPTGLPQVMGGQGHVIATAFKVPGGRAALIASWGESAPPEYGEALLSDAAHSVRLALERGEAEEAHQQAAALRRSHQLQRDFLSRLSHELRTPLTAIRGYATSLLAADVTWDDDSKARFLSRIASESARLGRLVGDLLDFSAIESGLLRLQPDWCDPSLVIEAALSCLPPERSGAVKVSCDDRIVPIWADHDRLEQVFVNLLDNAFQHNPPGVQVSVEVLMEGAGTLAVRVYDDGRGLPDELAAQFPATQFPATQFPAGQFPAGQVLPAAGQPLLASPPACSLATAPQAATAPQVASAPPPGVPPEPDAGPPVSRERGIPAGAGLGLSIARGIVEAHGGQMLLEPALRGTAFLVRLPVEAPAEVPA